VQLVDYLVFLVAFVLQPGMLLTIEGLSGRVNLMGKKLSGLVSSMTHFHK
jgi:hypothetical protein